MFWPAYAYHVIIGRLNSFLCCHLVFIVDIIVRRCFRFIISVIFLFCKQPFLSQTGKTENQITEIRRGQDIKFNWAVWQQAEVEKMMSMMNAATIKPVILAVLPLRSQELQVFVESTGEMEDTRESKEN